MPKKKIIKEPTMVIYSKIKNMILNKELLPGLKINQKELADKLKTSRTPVVYSLYKLESEGLVDSQRNKGFYVHKLSINELLNLFSIREFLEIIAIEDLVENASGKELKMLENLFVPFNNSTIVNQEKYRKADMEFHTMLLSFSSNNIAKKINENFQIFSRCYTAGLLRSWDTTIVEHKEIINALIAHDSDRAVKAVKNHLSITKEMIQLTVNNLKKMNVNPDLIFIDEVNFNDFKN